MLCGRSLMVPAWDGRARRRRPPTGEQNGRRLLRLLLHADHARVCAPPPPPRLRTRCIGVCLVQKLTDHFKLTDCCSCAAEPTRSRGTLSPRFSCSAPTYASADLQGWGGRRHGTGRSAVSMLARSPLYGVRDAACPIITGVRDAACPLSTRGGAGGGRRTLRTLRPGASDTRVIYRSAAQSLPRGRRLRLALVDQWSNPLLLMSRLRPLAPPVPARAATGQQLGARAASPVCIAGPRVVGQPGEIRRVVARRDLAGRALAVR